MLGLGANLGSRIATLRAAVDLLGSDDAVELVAMSPFYETAPVGPPQPAFVNAAARVRTSLSLEDLHARTLSVERALGRLRADAARWGPRLIDVDLLWAFGEAIDTPRLTVPHPRLVERAFALYPLLDVAPEALAELAPRLAELGARPPEIALPDVVVREDETGRHVEARANDPDDALAFALAALAPDRGGGSLSVIEAPVEDVAPTSFSSALARAIAQGVRTRGVSLVIRPPLGPALRLVTCEGAPGSVGPTEARLGGSNGRFVASLSLRIGNSRDVAK